MSSGLKSFSLRGGKDDPFDDSLEGHHRRRIFICTFSILAKFTMCDGGLQKEERLEIGRISREVLGLDQKRTKYAVQVFKEALSEESSLANYLSEFKELLHDQPRMIPWLLDILNKVALADGSCSVEERKFIRSVSDFYGISDNVRERSKATFEPESCKYRAILGLPPEADLDAIESRYVQLKKDYDVENLKAKGMPKEFISLAEEKQTIIEGAYQILSDKLKS